MQYRLVCRVLQQVWISYIRGTLCYFFHPGTFLKRVLGTQMRRSIWRGILIRLKPLPLCMVRVAFIKEESMSFCILPLWSDAETKCQRHGNGVRSFVWWNEWDESICSNSRYQSRRRRLGLLWWCQMTLQSLKFHAWFLLTESLSPTGWTCSQDESWPSSWLTRNTGYAGRPWAQSWMVRGAFLPYIIHLITHVI